MKISTKTLKQAISPCDLLVVFGVKRNKLSLPDGVELLPHALKSFESTRLKVRFTDAVAGPAKRVLLIGLGTRQEADAETMRRAAAIAAKKAEKTDGRTLTCWIDPAIATAIGDEATLAQALAEGLTMGAYRFEQLKRDPSPSTLKQVTIHGSGRSFKPALQTGVRIGQGNTFARELQDTPGNLMRPRDLVKAARKLASVSPRISIKVLDEKEMKRLGMGSLLSVSRGSSEPAYLIHLTYKPSTHARKKLCLVGKGLTFDAGGISLKPSARMEDMKYDMSGGATVMGIFHALSAGLELKQEIHGLIPTSENLPDGKANKPGDLVTAMNGLTIEVLNTDAEGRLILADALAYAVQKISPQALFDFATLTGAVIAALGHEYTGIMGNDQKLIDRLLAAGEASSERAWQLPLDDVHKRQMKGRVGDLQNINSEGNGSTAGGAFLSYFVDDIPWVHCDIAGTAWGTEDRDYQGGPQGTGVGVRLMLEALKTL